MMEASLLLVDRRGRSRRPALGDADEIVRPLFIERLPRRVAR